MFIEDWVDTTIFGWILGGEHEEASCGDIERDLCFVVKNEEFSWGQTCKKEIGFEWHILFFWKRQAFWDFLIS